MQLLYITDNNILHLHVVPTVVSVVFLAGALYGALRLAIDCNDWIQRARSFLALHAAKRRDL